jgi:fibronectin-binding autotransporter adhesin
MPLKGFPEDWPYYVYWGYYGTVANVETFIAQMPDADDYCATVGHSSIFTYDLGPFTGKIFDTGAGCRINLNGCDIVQSTFLACSLTQSSATSVNNMGDLFIGVTYFDGFPGPPANYFLTDGTLTASNMYLGGHADAIRVFTTGILNIGTLTLTGVPRPVQTCAVNVAGTLKVWDGFGSKINMVNGNLTVGTLDLDGNNSNLNWQGGTLGFTNTPILSTGPGTIFGNNLVLGETLPGAPRGLMTTQTLQIPAGSSVTVSGGSVTAGNIVQEGSVSLIDGSYSTTQYNTFIGYSGNATFTQSGGTCSITGTDRGTSPLVLGFQPGARGTYLLSGGTLNATSVAPNYAEVIGYFGNGSFVQTGGTNNAQRLLLGSFTSGSSTCTATYSLSGGTLSVAQQELVAGQGLATFTQTGGTHAVGTDLFIAYESNATGSYSLTGTGALSAGGTEYVGVNGVATFNQTGGVNTINSTGTALELAANTGSTGNYLLSGGTLSVANANNGPIAELIGANGNATFTQTGGYHTATSLVVAYGNGTGSFNLSGGQLIVTGNEDSGKVGTGSFNQTGGTNTISNTLYVGTDTGGRGSFSLSNTGVLSAKTELIGYYGAGTFVQSGGLNTISGGNGNALALASQVGSSGLYWLSGGTLSVSNTDPNFYSEVIGGSSNGTFDQSGGVHNTTRLLIGASAGNAASYLLSGGNLKLTLASPSYFLEVLGIQGGHAVFVQSGGTHDLTQSPLSLAIGYDSTSTGSYSLSNGVLLGVNEYVGYGARGTFTQSGGTHTLSGTLTLANNTGSSGTFLLQGGSLTVPQIKVNAGGDFEVSNGAILNVSTLTLSGKVGAAGAVAIGGATQIICNAATFAPAATLTLSNPVSGTSLTTVGAGTLLLTANNTYTGTTTVSAGALQIGNGGTTGSVPGAVVDNGTLIFNRSDKFSFSGAITGSGSLVQSGSGTLVYLGTGSYAGPTIINAGTLQLGNGLSSGTIAGSVIDNASLVWNRLAGFTYAGAITGSGSMTKLAPSTLLLSGSNSLTGSTTVSAGKLVFGSSFRTGSSLSISASASAVLAVRAGAARVLQTDTLSIAASAKLDLNDNDLVVNNGNFSAIQNLVFTGYSATPNTTKTGIISTVGQNTGGAAILALFDNALVGMGDYPFGSGETISAGAIVGKYTYIGDTNMDGQVTPQDYTATDSNLGTSAPLGISWFYGDTNFDGNIDPTDYAGIDGALGLGQGNPLAMHVMADFDELSRVVPEVGMGWDVGLGMLAMRRRRSVEKITAK